MEPKTLAFTGPRAKKLCGWKHAAYKTFVDKMVVALKDYYKIGVKRYISGGAQGFDQLAFLAVEKMRNRYKYELENVVYVPFKGQESIWPEDGCFGQVEYRQMIEEADEVKILTPGLPETRLLPKYLLNRNTEMVKDCDILLALYDKDDWLNNTGGGTQDAMRKAYTMEKQLHQIRYEIRDDQLRFKRIQKIQ